MSPSSFTSSFSSFCLFKLLVLAILFTPLVCAGPHPISLPALVSHEKAAGLGSLPTPQPVTFAVPCPGCFNGAADAALPFELVHVYTSNHCDNVSLTLNGVPFIFGFQEDVPRTVIRIPTANDRSVDLSIQGYCDQPLSPVATLSRQILFFDIDPLDGVPRDSFPSFTVVLNASAQAETLVIPHPRADTRCLSVGNQVEIESALFAGEDNAIQPEPQATDDSNESNAATKELRKRFSDERKLIRQLTMECRTPLLEELRDCNHNVGCSSKAICHHLRDAVINLMAELRSSLQQSPMISNGRQGQAIVVDEKSPGYSATAFPASDTADTISMEKKNMIILALEILAGVLGLAGLFACIRRHCGSPRRQTERLADREERKRAREYRKLARQEAFRKKWVTFKTVFHLPCGKISCEEKQVLVMDAAAFAVGEEVTVGDIEHAWDTAFSREYLATHARPLYKHEDGRSRSDSLPSYESEKLPDYSSQPDRDVVMVDGYRVSPPSLTGCSTNTAVTPDSSIPDLSPRCSRETLRTFTSRE